MNKDYQMVIYYENDVLVGVIYDNEGNVICSSDNISFWLKKYYNILNTLDEFNILYIYFNPLINEYKSLIIRHKQDNYYNNKFEQVQIREVNGNSLKSCLEGLNQKIGLEYVKILTKKKNEKYLKK